MLEKVSKKERVKQEIGQAAAQCFARYGLEKTTLDDIAAVVGLNKASLYYYYKNKEDIFLDVAVQEAGSYIAGLQAAAVEKKGIEQKLVYYLQERIVYYVDVLNRNKVSSVTLQKLLPGFFERYEHMMQEEIRFIAQLLKQAIKEGELPKFDADRLAGSLVNMSDALKHATEQQAVLGGQEKADYSSSIREIKYLIGLICKGLAK